MSTVLDNWHDQVDAYNAAALDVQRINGAIRDAQDRGIPSDGLGARKLVADLEAAVSHAEDMRARLLDDTDLRAGIVAELQPVDLVHGLGSEQPAGWRQLTRIEQLDRDRRAVLEAQASSYAASSRSRLARRLF